MIRMLSIILGAVALVPATACEGRTQTRAEVDAADARRRCGLLRSDGERAELYAVRCAEWFVARQGYTDHPATSDTVAIVSEGIEWAETTTGVLAYRRSTLEARAMGVCEGEGRGAAFTVVFRMRGGEGARAVTLDANFGSLRVQHQDFRAEAVAEGAAGCRPVPAGAGVAPGTDAPAT